MKIIKIIKNKKNIIIPIFFIFIFIFIFICYTWNYSNKSDKVKFGVVCGIASGNIPAYSCNYNIFDFFDANKYSIRHEINGIYYGIKYQCVEFSRRWLIHVYGITFDDVKTAYDIFNLSHAVRMSDNNKILWKNIKNGSSLRPVVGSILVWDKDGKFKESGHVAIVTEVSDTWIRVAEQNVDNTLWPKGSNYSRELVANYNKLGKYFIHDDYGKILGWKNLPNNFIPEPIPYPFE